MIISGKSADGSDAREFHGMFINPENEDEWSSEPYTLEQKRGYDDHERFWDIMNFYGNSKSIEEIYNEIKIKKSILSRRNRDFIVEAYENGKG